MEFLKVLSQTPGAPGREERVRSLIRDRLEPVASRMEVDAMGNLFVWVDATTSEPKPRTVMLACHMDEIAFYVRTIDDKGFIRLHHLGGFDTRNLFARRVLIQTRQGDILGNLNPAGRPIHLQTPEERSKIPKTHEFFVDTGLPADEIKKRVRPGDPVTLVAECIELGDLISGKCLDNRVACWSGVRAIERYAAQTDRPHTLCACFTVQEEIGIRGATVASNRVQPDIGIAIDVTLALDLPGASPDDTITALGKGVAIKIMDSGSVSDHKLVDTLADVATDHEVPFQYEILPLGGTDAAAIQRSGVGAKVVTLSVPCRYVHTVTETIHRDDLQACVDLILAFLHPDNKERVETLLNAS